MIEWVLLVSFIHAGYGGAIEHGDPFPTEHECRAEGSALWEYIYDKDGISVSWECVPQFAAAQSEGESE